MQDRDYQCVEDKGQIPTPETWVLVQALSSISFMDLGNLLFFSGLNFPHWYNVGVRFENLDPDLQFSCSVVLTCSLFLDKALPLSRPRFPHL